MTNKEAIKTLREIQREVVTDSYTYKCYDMAIKALEERKAGKWIPKDDARYYCSSCDGIAPKGCKWNYCPNCGAEMGGE